MDHVRIVELLKKASRLSGIAASEIHMGGSTEAITFVRMVIAFVLREEGVRVEVIAEAFQKSTKSVYTWLSAMKEPGPNASDFLFALKKP